MPHHPDLPLITCPSRTAVLQALGISLSIDTRHPSTDLYLDLIDTTKDPRDMDKEELIEVVNRLTDVIGDFGEYLKNRLPSAWYAEALLARGFSGEYLHPEDVILLELLVRRAHRP